MACPTPAIGQEDGIVQRRFEADSLGPSDADWFQISMKGSLSGPRLVLFHDAVRLYKSVSSWLEYDLF